MFYIQISGTFTKHKQININFTLFNKMFNNFKVFSSGKIHIVRKQLILLAFAVY